MTTDQSQKVKVTRSRNVSAVITRQRMVVSTSNLVETVSARCASRDTLSRSVGQLDRNYKYGGRSAYPMQKSTENVLVSRKYRALYKEIGIKESNDDVRTLTGSS